MSEPDGSDAGSDDAGTPADAASEVGDDPESDVGTEARDAGDEPGDGRDRSDDTEAAGDEVDRRLREIAVDAIETPSDVDGAAIPVEDAFEPAEIEVAEEFVDRVAESDPETIAGEIATLQLRVAALEGETAELEAEIEDLESRRARKQADFQNYKKRQQRRLEEEKQRATEDLVERLLDVRDNLQRALDQDDDADIRSGVESTLRQFDGELEREDVAVVEPEPGEETDPQRHEVLMRVESEEPAGTVAGVHRPGYEMAGKVLRPAQVTVSDGPDEDKSRADDEDESRADDEDESRADGDEGPPEHARGDREPGE